MVIVFFGIVNKMMSLDIQAPWVVDSPTDMIGDLLSAPEQICKRSAYNELLYELFSILSK